MMGRVKRKGSGMGRGRMLTSALLLIGWVTQAVGQPVEPNADQAALPNSPVPQADSAVGREESTPLVQERPAVNPRFCFCLAGRLEVLKEASGRRPHSWRLFRADGTEIALPGRQTQHDRYVQELPDLDAGIYSVWIRDMSGHSYGNAIYVE